MDRPAARHARRITAPLGALLLLGSLAATPAVAAITTRPVEYKAGELTLIGYLAYDDAKTGQRPGVLVVHDWIGLGGLAKKKAEELAELGYVALAVDMYGGGVVAADQEGSGPAGGGLQGGPVLDARAGPRRPRGAGEAAAASTRASSPPSATASAARRCWSWRAAGRRVAGVVSFHGGLDTPDPGDCEEHQGQGARPARRGRPARAAARGLRLRGRDAPTRRWTGSWSRTAARSTRSPTPRPGHDPSRGAAYNEAAARRSWRAMKDFFAEIF